MLSAPCSRVARFGLWQPGSPRHPHVLLACGLLNSPFEINQVCEPSWPGTWRAQEKAALLEGGRQAVATDLPDAWPAWGQTTCSIGCWRFDRPPGHAWRVARGLRRGALLPHFPHLACAERVQRAGGGSWSDQSVPPASCMLATAAAGLFLCLCVRLVNRSDHGRNNLLSGGD